jgi:MbtH protein
MSDPDMSLDFIVLINDEEQYSLWSGSIPVPAGWRVVHGPAGKQACLDYVDDVWTDLTPRSVRLARHASTVPAETPE